MTELASGGPLPMLQALLTWCDQRVVWAAREAQRPFSAYTLEAAGRPNLGLASVDDIRWGQYRPTSLDERTQRHETAWSALLGDWRKRLQAEEIRLAGYQTEPRPQEFPSRIPGIWATDLVFDFVSSTVSGLGRRHIAVQVWYGRLPPEIEAAAGIGDSSADAPPLSRPTLSTVRDLDPDIVAALLELHAEHVCRDLRVNLNPPGKASVLALAAAKLKHRASLGELRPTMSEEARVLSEWCATAAPSYQPLGESRISSMLGRLYRDLRSKAGD